jgi:hypothetical protein
MTGMIGILTNNSKSRSIINGSDRFANFNKTRDIPAHFKDFVIGFSCPTQEQHLRDGSLDSKTPLAEPDYSARIQKVLTNPLIAIGEKIRARPWWPAYCYLPTQPPLRNWDEAKTFLLLAGLEKMPDDSTALSKFVDWFQDLANAVEKCVDSILIHHGQPGNR